MVGAEDDSWSIIEPLRIVFLDPMSTKPTRGNGAPQKKRPGS
jgi:hypothetical protein